MIPIQKNTPVKICKTFTSCYISMLLRIADGMPHIVASYFIYLQHFLCIFSQFNSRLAAISFWQNRDVLYSTVQYINKQKLWEKKAAYHSHTVYICTSYTTNTTNKEATIFGPKETLWSIFGFNMLYASGTFATITTSHARLKTKEDFLVFHYSPKWMKWMK